MINNQYCYAINSVFYCPSPNFLKTLIASNSKWPYFFPQNIKIPLFQQLICVCTIVNQIAGFCGMIEDRCFVNNCFYLHVSTCSELGLYILQPHPTLLKLGLYSMWLIQWICSKSENLNKNVKCYNKWTLIIHLIQIIQQWADTFFWGLK